MGFWRLVPSSVQRSLWGFPVLWGTAAAQDLPAVPPDSRLLPAWDAPPVRCAACGNTAAEIRYGPELAAMAAALTEGPRVRAEYTGDFLLLHYELTTSEGWLTVFQSEALGEPADADLPPACQWWLTGLPLPVIPDGDLNSPRPERRGQPAHGTLAVPLDSGVSSRFFRLEWEPFPTRGRALVFANGAIDFAAMKASTPAGIITIDTPMIYKEPVEVCVDNLGIYDLDGDYTGTNRGTINGKYTYTGTDVFNIPSENLFRFGQFVDPQNDFRFSFFGDDGRNSPREAVMRSGALQLYHDVSHLRNAIVNDEFVKALELSPEIESNLLKRQGRDDLIMRYPLVRSRPASITQERIVMGGINLEPWTNVMLVGSRIRAQGVSFDTSHLPPISNAFDRSFAAADFAGLMFFWLTQNNDWSTYTEAFFGETFYPEIGLYDWQFNVNPAINDGLSAWVAYRILGKTEIYKDADYMSRMWSENGACHDGFIPCDKGQEIRNVMMYDHAPLQRRTVFAFRGGGPTGGLIFNGSKRYDGPLGSDLGALFIAAIFYDLSKEAGLGDRRADLLFWKAVSLIDHPTRLSMNQFGLKILESARLLFPDPQNASQSVFEAEIRTTLFSRGITLNDSASVASVLPPSVKGSEARDFSSPNPNYQPDPNDYGQSIVTSGVFTAEGEGSATLLQFMKHSKLGPCDSLVITDGTFSAEGHYQNDGSYVKEFTDRDLHNLFVHVPGKRIAWKNTAKRCETEFEGFYAEDLTSLGFRVVAARVDGFALEATRGSAGRYSFSVVNEGGASFEWVISQPGGAVQLGSGTHVSLNLDPDLPVRLQLRRADGQEVVLHDSLELLTQRQVLDLRRN